MFYVVLFEERHSTQENSASTTKTKRTACLYVRQYLQWRNIKIHTKNWTEKVQFAHTLVSGMKEFDKIIDSLSDGGTLSGQDAFTLFTTYGFPFEMTIELTEE